MAGNASRINGKKGGRPCGFETSESKTRRAMKQRWLEKINASADKIFNAHLDLALGCYTETQTTEGVTRVYKRPPDARSLHWIMEQVWGKAGDPIHQEDGKEQPEDEELSEELQRSINQAIEYAIPMSRRVKSTASCRPLRSPMQKTIS